MLLNMEHFFRKLLERGVPPVFLRLLLVMYMSQSAKVRWEGDESNPFKIKNGVKQGAVLSAILFCIYINDLIKEMRKNMDGCWINNEYVGIIVYADDIVLLSPCIDGLQRMIETCSRYAAKQNLRFSTHENPSKSKTKCIAFQQKKKDLPKLKLNNKDLPWVSTVRHLGTTVTNVDNCSMNQDLTEKRAAYIARNNELNQQYYYAHPETKGMVEWCVQHKFLWCSSLGSVLENVQQAGKKHGIYLSESCFFFPEEHTNTSFSHF